VSVRMETLAATPSSLFRPVHPGKARCNAGFRRMFQAGRLTIGLMFPIESFNGDEPTMVGQADIASAADSAGFAALWIRDVPLRVPSFGDTGQVYDPWVWLGVLSVRTRHIALATGSIVLPLRHPIHVAKAAASIDRLSDGRFVLGVASGDRAEEFPAFGVNLEVRGNLFQERFNSIRELLETEFPKIDATWGHVNGVDLVPKPWANGVPMIVTGHSRQDLAWIARHAEAWISYPRDLPFQHQQVDLWRQATAQCDQCFKPFAQSLYIDLDSNPNAAPTPIHLGYRLGRNELTSLLRRLERIGVNHVALNLKYGQRPAAEVFKELADYVTPQFSSLYPTEGPRFE
jgi:luciferase-type oxidoreductase